MKISVLIDLKPDSDNLLKYVSEFNKKANWPVELIHRNSIHLPGTAESASREEILDLSNKEVEQIIQAKAKSYFTMGKVKIRVSKEPLVNVLNASLNKEPKQLTFFGLKGVSLFKRLFLGSVAVKLVESYNGTLIGVPKEQDHFNVNHLYVAVSEKYGINTVEFNKLLDFYQIYVKKITFFTMLKNSDLSVSKNSLHSTLSELANIFSTRVKTEYKLFKADQIPKDVHKLVTDSQSSLLVLQRGSRLLNDRFFRNQFINELIYQSNLPLAILP